MKFLRKIKERWEKLWVPRLQEGKTKVELERDKQYETNWIWYHTVFELFKYGRGAKWNSFMKGGKGVFFNLRDVELKLSGIRNFEVIHKE
jgi:hypothetical protein